MIGPEMRLEADLRGVRGVDGVIGEGGCDAIILKQEAPLCSGFSADSIRFERKCFAFTCFFNFCHGLYFVSVPNISLEFCLDAIASPNTYPVSQWVSG